MTDIETLMHDLRQPGGDDRELSDRFALALGWVFHPLALVGGEFTLPFWTDPSGKRAKGLPFFITDLTAIVGTLREADRVYSISAFTMESSAVIGKMTASTDWHYAPTAERALMIARLALKKEMGE